MGGWPEYVPAAERRRRATRSVQALSKKGQKLNPVAIDGRAIATTFWGKAWCDNLESYMDYENRLPRGRTYVRNGSVVDLKITAGKIKAMVSGTSLYDVEITIKPVEAPRWKNIITACTGKIDSLVELLQGKLSGSVMETVTSREHGLFPSPAQISLKCSCPDWATMCKHVAATLYGVGNRLDSEPELLFLLRQVDHMELISKTSAPTTLGTAQGKGKLLKTEDLGSLFGIELEAEASAAAASEQKPKPKVRLPRKKVQRGARDKRGRNSHDPLSALAAEYKAFKTKHPARAARVPESIKDQAKRLFDSGATYSSIANACAVSLGSVRAWIDAGRSGSSDTPPRREVSPT